MKKIKLLFVLILLVSFQQAFCSVTRAKVIDAIENRLNKPSFEENNYFPSVYGEVSSGQILICDSEIVTRHFSRNSKCKAFQINLIPSLKQSNTILPVTLIFGVVFYHKNSIPIYLKTETFLL